VKPDTSSLVVLKSHNSRPSLFIELEVVQDEAGETRLVHKLTWLVFGHVEDFDLWLQMPLTLNEANDLVDGGPRLMDKYVASKPGRMITLVTYGSRRESLTSLTMPVPANAQGVVWLLEAMVEHLTLQRLDPEPGGLQPSEIKEDLRAMKAVLAAV